MRDVAGHLAIDIIGMEQVRTLYENDITKPLFNTIVEDGIPYWICKTGRAAQLVAKTVPIEQQTYQWEYIDDVRTWLSWTFRMLARPPQSRPR
ncbi:hypothetical protein OF158_01030 [Weizmannia sp. WK01]|uniref:hypothetical protein n=1 Tax=Weizmannia sp. WK01 TaxID=2984845 RepID=UPI0021F80689|nr:hypothetical protein [Weizmannia sp. WK01]UYT05032.1 hypothetical protein OF158_01030 [Weizmannia sp. WK01]